MAGDRLRLECKNSLSVELRLSLYHGLSSRLLTRQAICTKSHECLFPSPAQSHFYMFVEQHNSENPDGPHTQPSGTPLIKIKRRLTHLFTHLFLYLFSSHIQLLNLSRTSTYRIHHTRSRSPPAWGDRRCPCSTGSGCCWSRRQCRPAPAPHGRSGGWWAAHGVSR